MFSSSSRMIFEKIKFKFRVINLKPLKWKTKANFLLKKKKSGKNTVKNSA